MNDMLEQRRYSRCSIPLSVQVRLETGILVEGRACNVSLNGLFFETDRTLPLGSRVKVKMIVGGESKKNVVLCAGIVSRLDDRGVAIEITCIDEESVLCLSDLIRKAAAENVRMEEERERRLMTPVAKDAPSNV